MVAGLLFSLLFGCGFALALIRDLAALLWHQGRNPALCFQWLDFRPPFFAVAAGCDSATPHEGGRCFSRWFTLGGLADSSVEFALQHHNVVAECLRVCVFWSALLLPRCSLGGRGG